MTGRTRAAVPIAVLPEPLDVMVQFRVAHDATLQFEGHTYSVPFQLLGRAWKRGRCQRGAVSASRKAVLSVSVLNANTVLQGAPLECTLLHDR